VITFRDLGYKGRLGNQLFQIAATIGIARDRGDEPIFPADWHYRPYFSLPDSFFGQLTPDVTEATEFATHLDPRCREYLQDINLFIRHLDEVREYFSPSDLAWSMMQPSLRTPTPRLVLHVRRGDNIVDPGVPNKFDYHLTPPLTYYLRGIGHFPEHVLWIFSDDIPWCREHLPPAEVYGHGVAYAKEHEPQYRTYAPTDWQDLFLMSRGDAFVVSGSTFGIWGALLSGVGPDNVVRPNGVYGPALPWINDATLFHPEWEVINCF
jgi:Glycosyl transferase family 11